MDLKKIKYIASKTLRKNLDDLTALASGGYPGFVYRKLTLPGADQIPVFTFHRLEPVSFEVSFLFNRRKAVTPQVGFADLR